MTISNKGFTLIELLITLSIIAVVIAIGIASYQVVLKNARDAQRKSDLSGIQSALEQYRADSAHYPLLGTELCEAGKFYFNCAFKSVDEKKTYLNKVPNDPRDPANTPYSYQPYEIGASATGCSQNEINKCLRYCLFAKMENTSNIGGVGDQPVPTQCTLPNDYNYIMVLP